MKVPPELINYLRNCWPISIIVLITIVWGKNGWGHLGIITALWWISWIVIAAYVPHRNRKKYAIKETFRTLSQIGQVLIRKLKPIQVTEKGMEPTILKGETILYRPLRKEDLTLLKVGDIVVYSDHKDLSILQYLRIRLGILNYDRHHSNSMAPLLLEGDAIIYKPLNNQNLNLLQVGDVVIYKAKFSYEISRIYSINSHQIDLRVDNPDYAYNDGLVNIEDIVGKGIDVISMSTNSRNKSIDTRLKISRIKSINRFHIALKDDNPRQTHESMEEGLSRDPYLIGKVVFIGKEEKS